MNFGHAARVRLLFNPGAAQGRRVDSPDLRNPRRDQWNLVAENGDRQRRNGGARTAASGQGVFCALFHLRDGLLTFDGGERVSGLRAALIKLDDVPVLPVSAAPIALGAINLRQLQSGVEVFRGDPQNLPATLRGVLNAPRDNVRLRE